MYWLFTLKASCSLLTIMSYHFSYLFYRLRNTKMVFVHEIFLRGPNQKIASTERQPQLKRGRWSIETNMWELGTHFNLILQGFKVCKLLYQHLHLVSNSFFFTVRCVILCCLPKDDIKEFCHKPLSLCFIPSLE